MVKYEYCPVCGSKNIETFEIEGASRYPDIGGRCKEKKCGFEWVEL